MDPSIPLFDDLADDTATTREYREKLDAERLTAEFASPLNRNNLRRKLKAARVEQTSLLEVTERAAQERLW